MNKKDYIDAINEIKVGEDLKKKTLEETKDKKSYSGIYKFTTIAATLAIVFVIACFLGGEGVIENKDEIKEIVKTGALPTVNNFENLYEILKLGDKEENNRFSGTDSVIQSAEIGATIQEESSKATNSMELNDYSKTNVQVEGVDEADIVKTDGKNIYYISNNKIVIVDATKPSKLQILSETIYEKDETSIFIPNELFLFENKLVVIGTKNLYNKTTENRAYYYNSLKQYTVAKVYNIENVKVPNLEREVEIEGNYLSSRMIGENIYLLANKYIYTYGYYDYKVEEINANDFKPTYRDTALTTDEKCIEFDSIYYFPNSEEKNYLDIVGFNVTNSEPANIESYLGAGTEIYSSENNLYVAKVKYDYNDKLYYSSNYDVNTYIYKFKLENSKAIYTNVGNVPGVLLNQFSMDEHNGYFRIATTNNKTWDNRNNTNNLYVLDEELKTVGKIEGLARDEKIYSVRFMQNRAYIVTFVQTDPLFVIDLSNPTQPVVLGELKIPGFSEYLHPYDENHIIGFGKDTKIVNYGYGDQVVTIDMKMALFDVTDPNNPKELYVEKIGESGTYSELLNNHKALLFSKEKNIIAFPITISEDANNYSSRLRFQGAIIYGLDLSSGFHLKGKIAPMEIKTGYKDYDYTKAVERIIYINDTLFTLSNGMIKATNMRTMQEIDSIDIEVKEDRYIYSMYID